jgi:histidinol phosphatase-like PHP family hydrolase
MVCAHTVSPWMNNARLSEWLARNAEAAEPGSRKARALRRAARAALTWPQEAGELVDAGLPLTSLHLVGPYVADVIATVMARNDAVESDPLRSGFLTRSRVTELLRGTALRDGVRADFQVHTTWSDGHATVGVMADEAARLGRTHIVITDHSKGLPIAGGKDERAFAAQREEIAQENARLRAAGTELTLLAGIEMNLSPNGDGDMDPGLLRSLDLVLGAFHSKLRLRDDQTDRYLAALRNPSIDVLAHPRGRIFNFRIGLSARWEVVFEEALRRDVALEIDGYPDRQDLDVDLLRLAAEMGVRISMGSDAHAPVDLAFLDFAIAAAAEAGVASGRIINTMSVDELREWTGSRRRRAPAL